MKHALRMCLFCLAFFGQMALGSESAAEPIARTQADYSAPLPNPQGTREHDSYIRDLKNEAERLRMSELHTESARLYEQLLCLQEQQSDGESSDIHTTLNTLCGLYANTLWEPDLAQHYCKKEPFSRYRSSVAATVYNRMGEHALARDEYASLLTQAKDSDDNAYGKTNIQARLACTYSLLGDYKKCRELIEDLRTMHDARPMYIHDNSQWYSNAKIQIFLAGALAANGEYTKAWAIYEPLSSNEIREKVFPYLSFIAMTAERLENYSAAHSLYLWLDAWWKKNPRKAIADNYPWTMPPPMVAAKAIETGMETEDAKRFYMTARQAFGNSVLQYGLYHPLTAVYASALSRFYTKQGELEQAILYAKIALLGTVDLERRQGIQKRLAVIDGPNRFWGGEPDPYLALLSFPLERKERLERLERLRLLLQQARHSEEAAALSAALKDTLWEKACSRPTAACADEWEEKEIRAHDLIVQGECASLLKAYENLEPTCALNRERLSLLALRNERSYLNEKELARLTLLKAAEEAALDQLLDFLDLQEEQGASHAKP